MTGENVTPNEILKTYPVFRVASQILHTDKEITIRNVRVKDKEELAEFLRRILNVRNLATLAFLEVHRLTEDGNTELVMGDINRPWPKNTETRTIQGVIAPRVPMSVITKTADSVANVIAKAKQYTGPTKEPIKPAITETGRPRMNYWNKVA